MTRREFVENVTTISDLIDFAYEHDYNDVTEDIYTKDSYEDWMVDTIHSERDLGDIIRIVNELPSNDYDYYYRDYYGEWYGIEDDSGVFFEKKDEILERCDECDFWDEEDEPEEEIIEQEPPLEPEPVSINAVFQESSEIFNTFTPQEAEDLYTKVIEAKEIEDAVIESMIEEALLQERQRDEEELKKLTEFLSA